MFEEIIIQYYHPDLNIGVQDVKNAWLITDPPVKLVAGLHSGLLVFRLPGSPQRTSYNKLKKGLVKKRLVIRQSIQLLPF